MIKARLMIVVALAGTAVTVALLRPGPGLVLDLRDGRRFAVTVADPQTPAALLTALRSAGPA